MESDGYLIEVALPINSGGVNELLVLGDAARRFEVLVQERTDGLEVEVEDSVGLRKQTGSLWRSLGAEEDGHGQEKQDRGQYPKRSAGASVHGPSGIP
jgi:hypothetical protein